MAHRNLPVSAGIVLGMAASMLLGRRKPISLRDKTVFVTGGSRGLGLLLAQEFASRGAKIAISARDRSELGRAGTQLRTITDQVLTLEADMTMREEVELARRAFTQHGILKSVLSGRETLAIEIRSFALMLWIGSGNLHDLRCMGFSDSIESKRKHAIEAMAGICLMLA